MRISLKKIADIVGGQVFGDAEIQEIITDTRRPFSAGGLFVALKGPHFDGHEHVDAALSMGCVASLANRSVAGPHVLVDDTLRALQSLAAWWRQQFEIPVIGITGSNGKTIVKEMLASILSRKFTVWRSPGSYNSQVGVALSLLGIRAQHDVAIIEAGISEIGEMPALQAMIQPTIGVLTGIGNAHLAGLKNLETISEEKRKLFVNCDVVFAPQVLDKIAPIKNCHWVASLSEVRLDDMGSDFSVDLLSTPTAFRLNALGAHNVQNAAVAIQVAHHLGLDPSMIRAGLAAFELSPMRLEIHTTPSGITLLNDAYSSDPISARAALATLEQYAGGAPRIAILGDMLDLGTASAGAHQELGRLVAESGVQRLATLGPESAATAKAAREAGMPEEQAVACRDLSELSELLELWLEPGDVVLFKGSRAMGLERAAERLLESVAPTRLYVDLDAIKQNVRALRTLIGPKTKLMAVVKSFAYGNDATRVSQTLVREGIDWLGVAYADEAIPLRRRGLSVPILVTNTLAAEADKIVKYGLTGLVNSLPVVEALDEHARRRSMVVDIHIEVDTGMGRVGIAPDEVLALARSIRGYANVRLTGLMTHFPAADDADDDGYTLDQIRQFDEVHVQLLADGFQLDCVHAANTAGAWRFPSSRYDMVRVGLGLYGFHPSHDVEATAHDTRPALRFTTQIIHVKEVEPGTSISYGRRWVSPDRRVIATIAAGYSDGFGRFMSNGGIVLVHGQRCEVVGSVCMDVSMVDVTNVPDAKIGDEVVLFGSQGEALLRVEEMADRGDTINYEILCKVSPRVRRIFVREET